jgi:DNA-binding SARP family transcriptional activator
MDLLTASQQTGQKGRLIWLQSHLGRSLEGTELEFTPLTEQAESRYIPEWNYFWAARMYMSGRWEETIQLTQELMPLFLQLGEVDKFQGSAALLGLATIKKGEHHTLNALYDLLKSEEAPQEPLSYLLQTYFLARMEHGLGDVKRAFEHYQTLLFRTERQTPCSWMRAYAMIDYYGFLIRTENDSLYEVEMFFHEHQWLYEQSVFSSEAGTTIGNRPSKRYLFSNLHSFLNSSKLIDFPPWDALQKWCSPAQQDTETLFLMEWHQMMSAIQAQETELVNRHRIKALYWSKKTGDPLFQRLLDLPLPQMNTPQETIAFHFFGGFQVYRGHDRLDPPRFKRKKSKEILAYLLVQPRYRCTKEQLIDLFFTDVSEEKSMSYLYVNIHAIKSWLTQTTGFQAKWIELKDGLIQLWEDGIAQVDIEQFLKQTSVGDQLWTVDREATVTLYEKAFMDYTQPIAPEWTYCDWMEQIRVNVSSRFYHLSMRLVQYYREDKQWEKALSTAQRYLEFNPIEEEMVQIYIEILLVLGQRSAAKRSYLDYKNKLWTELQLEPGDSLKLWIQKHVGGELQDE